MDTQFNATVGHYINHNLTAQNHWEMKFNTWLNHGQPQPHTIACGGNPGTFICLTLVLSKMLYLLNISSTHPNSCRCLSYKVCTDDQKRQSEMYLSQRNLKLPSQYTCVSVQCSVNYGCFFWHYPLTAISTLLCQTAYQMVGTIIHVAFVQLPPLT